MKPIIRWFAVLAFVALVASFAAQSAHAKACRANEVDVALVLAVDMSSSISVDNWELQQNGYAEAFKDPGVIQAITSGRCHRIAVTMFAWGDPKEQKILVPWQMLYDQTSAFEFAKKIALSKRPSVDESTFMGSAVAFALRLLSYSRATFSALQYVIDVSGDGTDNYSTGYSSEMGSGRSDAQFDTQVSISVARDAATRAGVAINGLPILGSEANLDAYYKNSVVTQDGFVEVANGFEDFGRAIKKKLVMEIETVASAQ